MEGPGDGGVGVVLGGLLLSVSAHSFGQHGPDSEAVRARLGHGHARAECHHFGAALRLRLRHRRQRPPPLRNRRVRLALRVPRPDLRLALHPSLHPSLRGRPRQARPPCLGKAYSAPTRYTFFYELGSHFFYLFSTSAVAQQLFAFKFLDQEFLTTPKFLFYDSASNYYFTAGTLQTTLGHKTYANKFGVIFSLLDDDWCIDIVQTSAQVDIDTLLTETLEPFSNL